MKASEPEQCEMITENGSFSVYYYVLLADFDKILQQGSPQVIDEFFKGPEGPGSSVGLVKATLPVSRSG